MVTAEKANKKALKAYSPKGSWWFPKMVTIGNRFFATVMKLLLSQGLPRLPKVW